MGCVSSVLSQTVSQSAKTFQRLPLRPQPTTAENVFAWVDNKPPELQTAFKRRVNERGAAMLASVVAAHM